MKKLIIALSLMLISLSYSAQVQVESYAVKYGEWSNYDQTWTWGDWKYVNITFTLQGSLIMVDDLAKSTYYTYGDVDIQKGYNSWNAIDENNQKCIFMMTTNKTGESYITVMYKDTCFKYAY